MWSGSTSCSRAQDSDNTEMCSSDERADESYPNPVLQSAVSASLSAYLPSHLIPSPSPSPSPTRFTFTFTPSPFTFALTPTSILLTQLHPHPPTSSPLALTPRGIPPQKVSPAPQHSPSRQLSCAAPAGVSTAVDRPCESISSAVWMVRPGSLV